MSRLVPAAFTVLTTLLVPTLHAQTTANAALTRQVFVAESTFAASLANRDTAAFAKLVSPEAVFFGQKSVMRGKAVLLEAGGDRGARLGQPRAQQRAGLRPRWQAVRRIQLDLAPRAGRHLAGDLRQGVSGVQLREGDVALLLFLSP